MTAVAVAPAGRSEIVQWLAPAPLWDSAPAGSAQLTQPWISELRGDDFVDDFLSMLAGSSGSAADLAALAPETTTDGTATAPFRLYQPLSQRYYLVSATLACRRPGIPDHTLRPERHEAVFFVMRRVTSGGEQAFVPDESGGTWVTAPDHGVADGEKQLPMHRAPVTPYAASGSITAALGLGLDGGTGRALWFGYVPVGLERTLVRPMADPAGALDKLRSSNTDPNLPIPNPALDWFFQRVVQPWSALPTAPSVTDPNATSSNREYASLYILLDLGDWVRTYLKTQVWDLLGTPNANLPTGVYGDFVRHLQATTVTTRVGTTPGSVTVANALLTLFDPQNDCSGLLVGDDHNVPGSNYDLTGAASNANLLGADARKTLDDSGAQAQVPPELEGMIQEEPPPTTTGTPSTPASGKSTGATYVIRVVLRYDPCCYMVSAPTHTFQLARALAADAPARQILIQAPDITHLRAFKRGVAIETPASLQRILNGVTPGVLKGDGINPSAGLGMICSFSLQIIFLVAFILMFVVLLLLNFVFWWLPFLKICFPIPVPPRSSAGPTP